MSTVILEKVLRDRGIKYKQHHLGVLVAEAAENDGLPADIIFSDMINGLLLVSANLPFEIEPARTEVMTAAACTLNAASEFGCFYISPGRQIMEFRGYTPCRADCGDDVREQAAEYLVGKTLGALSAVAELLRGLCDGEYGIAAFDRAVRNLSRA